MYKWIVLLVFTSVSAGAQKFPELTERVKSLTCRGGFIPCYLDQENGKVFLEIDRWNTEMLYATSLPAGLGSNDIGLDRGRLGDEKIVRFERNGKMVWMIQPNYAYRAERADSFERRAVEQSFASGIVASFAIEAVSGSRVLVDATDFLLRDAIRVVPTLRRMNQGSYSADKSRSGLYWPNCRNFPLNTELEATVTFVNTDGNTGSLVREAVATDEAITLRIHHSFVQLPDDRYKPRTFDPRSGYNAISYFDFATPVSEPIEKYRIVRHRLEKLHPDKPMSEAVKPIIYYLDNGTPEPIRSALLEGARWWNQAFEAAGFINAFQVRLLPDSADPMDIRYNMINWVHRSTRGWSYGASVIDPRTGEIIKGNVTLGSLRVRQDYLIFSGLLSPYAPSLPKDDPMLKAALWRLRQLAAHEVGHTLGLMHNYASSVSNRASVMDYPHPLVRWNDKTGKPDFDQVYTSEIGAWDKAAINWGYRVADAGTNEKTLLDGILTQAIKNGLPFISDRDARAPGGLHEQAHLWDNGKDAVAEFAEVLKVRKQALEAFGENSIRQGTPMAFLEDALVPVYFYHRYQLEAVSKLVGGAQYNYALKGDGQQVFRPLDAAVQTGALDALLKALAPEVLAIPQQLIPLIPPRPAGYDFGRELFRKRTGLAFDRLAPAETAADVTFSFLFHPERLNRLVSQQYLTGLSLPAVLEKMMAATWKAPRKTGYHLQIQQQTEQVLLTYLMWASVHEENAFETRASVLQSLDLLKQWIRARQKTAAASEQGHYLLALNRMNQPEKARPAVLKEIPPGAPIGCEWMEVDMKYPAQ